MSLVGSATIVIWNDVTEEFLAEFIEWHSQEHIPERIGIPGFRRARRYRAMTAGPEFLTIYEVIDVAALTSLDYLDRLNSPSVWTQRMLPRFRNTARSLCRVEVSAGDGAGSGFLCSVRLPDELRLDQKSLARFGTFTDDLVRTSQEVLGAHLLSLDHAASRQEMTEKKLRVEPVGMPATILLVEGTTENVSAAAGELTAELERLGLASGHGAMTGIYRQELCLTSRD